MASIHGVHHVTAIAGGAQGNLDFYTRVLGMRLVKRSVNQDDPGTYHLFYADAEGHPGSDLTFFPWQHLPPVHKGVGLATEVMFAVPMGSLPYWTGRLTDLGAGPVEPVRRFNEDVLPFADPDGLALAVVETDDQRDFTAWSDSAVPADHQIRGIHGVRLLERDLATSMAFLGDVLGFSATATEDGWQRFGLDGGRSGGVLDVRESRDAPRGRWGTGGVHHVAWRVTDDDEQRAVRERVLAAGLRPTEVIDRFWFRSVCFLEPGGVLFELATDGPGFGVDEDLERLGERLILPPWLEPQRQAIAAALPPLSVVSA